MDQTNLAKCEEYLTSIFEAPVRVSSIEQLGNEKAKELKSFGYGKPYLIRCVVGDQAKELVLESMNENTFGHDHFSDRAQSLLWYYSAANRLSRHARSIDVGAFAKEQKMISLGDAEEFFVLNEFVPGYEYAVDLRRIQTTGEVEPLDLQKVEALADYLADIHALKHSQFSLYIRRIRELIGHGECIMGLIDNYPSDDPVATAEELQEVEVACLKWRWKLKRLSHRLSQVHGDFHPWNILFQDGVRFQVLDRSRGEWGEPADDVTALTINYVFHSVQKYGFLHSTFERMFLRFWDTYLSASKDAEILKAVQPFYAWRSLVLTNPIWYPKLPTRVRQQLLGFTKKILAVDIFRPERIHELLS